MRHDDRDAGIATPVEMMYLVVFCLVAVLFIGFVGRLHAAAVEVANAAQSAARAASMASTPDAAVVAARSSVAASPLRDRCSGGLRVTATWSPSATGTWQGGAVTVVVTCIVPTRALTGVWSSGSRTVSMRDSQPVDRYQR
jgi:Flp pilus assembly protein TadG